jgi:hypothetical protein
VIHHLCPTRIAELCGFFGGADDIDKQDRRQRPFEFGATIGGPAPDRNTSSQRFIAMIASPRDCGFCIVFCTLHRAATNRFRPRCKRPVNLSPVSDAMDLDGAPLQETRRANPANHHAFDVYPETFD